MLRGCVIFNHSLRYLQSTASTKSWSSGKAYKAPKPPFKAKSKLWIQRNKKQLYLWFGFACLVLAIIIAVLVILQRFIRGSEKYSREEIDENYLYGNTKDKLRYRLSAKIQTNKEK